MSNVLDYLRLTLEVVGAAAFVAMATPNADGRRAWWINFALEVINILGANMFNAKNEE